MALVEGTLAHSRAALADRVVALAEHFERRGVRRGDRVLLQGGNSTALVVTLITLMHLDTSIVLVDHQQTAADTRDAMARARVRWVVREADGGLPAGAGVSEHRTICYHSAVRSLTDRTHPRGPVSLAAWAQRSDAAVLWSSGTTGPAKGVVKSGRAIFDNITRTLETMGYGADDVLAPLLPFSHQYGLSMLLLWWTVRCSLVVTPYRLLHRALDDVIACGATVVDATPGTYHALLGLTERRPHLVGDLARVRIWGVGGAPLPRLLAERFAAVLGRPLLDGYGLTEVGNVALATCDDPVGCGRPLPGVGLRVVGEDGLRASADTVGEVEVRSDGLMEGYLCDDGTFSPVARSSWYATRDLGYLDHLGHLHVIGRKQAVHRSGYTLYPATLERKAEACGCPVKVFALEDERRGCQLVFVVADPLLRDARHWWRQLRALLAPYEQPSRVRVVERLPLNANGKVDEAALRVLTVAADAARI